MLLGGFLALLGNFSFRGGTRIHINYDFSGNLQSGAAGEDQRHQGRQGGRGALSRRRDGSRHATSACRCASSPSSRIASRSRSARTPSSSSTRRACSASSTSRFSRASWDQPPLDPSHSVEGVNPPRTDLIVARLYEFLDSITGLLRDDKDVIKDFLQSGASVVRTLDDILKTNKAEIGRLLGNVDALSKQAADLLGSIRAGVGDASQLRATLANIEGISASIKRDIDPLIAKAKKALDGVDRVTSVIGPGERDKLQKALDELVTVGDKAEKLTSDAQALVADIRKGKGTAGALLVDPQIYDDLKELVRDLKRNPWKFFWKE